MTAREAQFTVELDIQLRIATKDDLPKLEWYGQYTHFRNLFRRAFREQQAGRRLMVIADCNNFPIGHIFIQFSHPDYPPSDGEARAYLYSLRVMEMFRDRGIGTRLIEEAELHIINRGHRWATIAVAKDNEGALRLYERMGYEVFREDAGDWSYIDHKGHTRFVHEPCWMLQKQLPLR